MPREIKECKKCGWRWFPRKEEVFVCPKCRSYRWNEEPTKDNKRKPREIPSEEEFKKVIKQIMEKI